MIKKMVMMSTRKMIKTEQIELDPPQDVIFVMKGMENPRSFFQVFMYDSKLTGKGVVKSNYILFYLE